ncbi:MAG: DUF2851 family protein [Candidatus Hydrogenedentes bacterium]|nr:DUF2851 family protein [Candidatus Hydrogenedentota bacterium]
MASVQQRLFSDAYAGLRAARADVARERPDAISEDVVQCIWYDQLFRSEGLETEDGTSLKVVSPGWWNRGEGPDFKGAQIEVNGRLRTGDVEVDLKHAHWRGHGHNVDPRYDEVLLHVVLESEPSRAPIRTASGQSVQTLLLPRFLENDVMEIADRVQLDDYPFAVPATRGHCAALVEAHGKGRLTELLHLAGEWRMLFKARAMRERMERVGENQAVYESFLAACGFSHFKFHMRAIAQQLHYDRARQLAREDPLLLEAAFLQIAGLLPKTLPEGTTAIPHFARLRALRRDRLAGLRTIPLEWKRVGVRPNNNPERRLAGAARFVARTAPAGICESLEAIWREDAPPLTRRRKFEALFPGAQGFWATHCTWTGKRMERPSAPLGPGRIRSIIGNIFVTAGLALARQRRDRLMEERVLDFFASLPQEVENKVQKIMLPRMFGEQPRPKIDFRMQQGLLQMHSDWCEANPSCRNCRVVPYLDIASGPGSGVVVKSEE